MNACATCGGPLPPNKAPGRKRKFCSERCRKRQYDLACVDCGARVSGTDPGSRNGREPRCVTCRCRETAAERTVWTRELIVARVQEWAHLYGEPPALPDWYPPTARILNDEARVRRFTEAGGHWPWMSVVVTRFGTWNAAIEAAGFSPRAASGVAANERRKRKYREQVAA